VQEIFDAFWPQARLKFGELFHGDRLTDCAIQVFFYWSWVCARRIAQWCRPAALMKSCRAGAAFTPCSGRLIRVVATILADVPEVASKLLFIV